MVYIMGNEHGLEENDSKEGAIRRSLYTHCHNKGGPNLGGTETPLTFTFTFTTYCLLSPAQSSLRQRCSSQPPNVSAVRRGSPRLCRHGTGGRHVRTASGCDGFNGFYRSVRNRHQFHLERLSHGCIEVMSWFCSTGMKTATNSFDLIDYE